MRIDEMEFVANLRLKTFIKVCSVFYLCEGDYGSFNEFFDTFITSSVQELVEKEWFVECYGEF